MSTPESALTEKIGVIDPDGNPFSVPKEYLSAALESGYREATPQDYHHQDLLQQVQDSPIAGRVAAATGSAADMMTFGASGAALKHFDPQDAEKLQAAQETYPGFSAAGTAGGLVTPLAAGGELFNGVTGAGKLVGNATEKVAAPVVGNALGSAAGSLARFGTEGAALAAPKAGVELLADDPGDAAETLTYGAGAGAALGAVHSVLSGISSLGPAQGARDYLSQKVTNFEVGQDLRQLGFSKGILNKMTPDRMNELRDFARNNDLIKIFHDAGDDYQLADQLRQQSGRDIGNILNTIDQKVGPQLFDGKAAVADMQRVGAQLGRSSLFTAEKNAFDKAMQDARDLFLDSKGNSKPVDLAEAQLLKQDFGEYAYGDFQQARDGRKVMAVLERTLDNHIGKAIDDASTNFPKGTDLYSEWRAAKTDYGNWKDLMTPLQNKLNMDMGNQFFKPSDMITAAAGAASGSPGGAIKGLALSFFRHAYGPPIAASVARGINQAVLQRNSLIDKAVDKFFSGGTLEPTGLGASAQFLESNEKDQAKHLEQMRTDLGNAVNNPQLQQEQLTKATAGVASAFPEVAGQVNQNVLNVMQVLNGSIPKPSAAPNPFVPSTPYVPSDADVHAFQTTLRVATDPFTVVNDLAAGKVDPKAVDALKQLYPYFYQKMQQKLLEKAAAKKVDVPFEKRVQLSWIFGTPIDEATSPASVSLFQSSYNNPGLIQQENKARGVGQGVTFSDQTSTEMQKLENRQR